METATNTTRRLDLEGMTGDDCVQEVTTALKGVPNVTTQSVKVGSAIIGTDQTGCDAACSAINGAGYKACEAGRSAGINGANRATQTTPSGQFGRTSESTPPLNLVDSNSSAKSAPITL